MLRTAQIGSSTAFFSRLLELVGGFSRRRGENFTLAKL